MVEMKIFGLTARSIVLLVTSIVVSSPLARSDEPTASGREVMSGSTASQAVDSRSASDGEASPRSHPALRSELLAMVEKDQAVRGRINAEGETLELLEEESRIDVRNTAQMKPILDEFGWPTQSMVGKDGGKAAWLLAMHADHDTKFQRRCLDLMKAALKRGEALAVHVAYLTDRVHTREGKPQVYGTQYGVIDSVRRYFPIEDLKQVEKRRAEVGLPPLGEYRELTKSLAITLGRPRPTTAQQDGQAEREKLYERYLEFPSYVKGGSIEPHWMADGSSFWYAEGGPANTVIWKVDPVANTKTPLFDTVRLRQAMAEALGHEPPDQGLPFDKFNFVDESEAAVKFTVENIGFVLQLDTYAITRATVLSEEEEMRLAPRSVRKGLFAHWPPVMEVLSPDRQWFAGVKEHNLRLRSTHDARNVQLTNDGIKDFEWDVEGARWSPDSSRLAVMKVDYHEVPQIPIVHWTGRTVEVEWMRWRKAGKPLPQTDLYIVDIRTRRKVRVDTSEEPDQYIEIVGWRPDGSELLFLRTDRTLKQMFLMAANPTNGAVRVILTETRKTFVVGLYVYYVGWTKFLRPFTWLDDGKRFIWTSERDGWNHLYSYDMDGTLIRQLTAGDFPVVKVLAVDREAGWVYFSGHGDRRRPYDTHLYRVNLDGKSFTRLTGTTGQHDTQFAPSKEFFLDTHSSLNRPPVVELRRADGTLLRILSEGDISALLGLRWTPPETFVVKAADGKTDLYGVLYKPFDFDADKQYPVIESIYAGPQMSFVPGTFADWTAIHPQAMAQLGFVVFQVDGRGTPGRGKAFQDVVYGNFGRHEIPDHVATLRQLADERPYMDLSRVGILGHSWGGYFAIRALLLAPDVYQVGVASAPAVAMSGFSRSIEPYMGLPQNNKEAYEYGSNLRLAGNLKGKLLLIHGTSDDDVPFSETMKMVEAFIRVGKPYDLIVLPEKNHAIGSDIAAGDPRSYVREAIRRYFQEHLKP